MSDIASLSRCREILDKYGIRASREYGQNFLVDSGVVAKTVAEVPAGSLVLEIGPGLGALTEKLAERASEVICWEIDPRMADVLNGELHKDNVEIINADFLQADLRETIRERKKRREVTVVSNLPYYITTNLLLKIFENLEGISRIVVMMQKEVAQRFTEHRDVKDYGPVNVMADYYCRVRIVCRADRSCFLPRPNVDSTVICFEVIREWKESDRQLFRLVADCFTQRRKSLLNNLKNKYTVDGEKLKSIGLPENVRAEQLSIEDFIRLQEVLSV